MPTHLERPLAGEYDPYYENYLRHVTESDIMPVLAEQLRETAQLLRSFPDDQASRTNEPGRWSIKQIIGHVIDCERIFAYRALRFARNDATDLPGFEENAYMAAGSFDHQPLHELVSEYEHVRQATIALFRPLNRDACLRHGTADGKRISVRALAWCIAAHERHHVKILRQRYL